MTLLLLSLASAMAQDYFGCTVHSGCHVVEFVSADAVLLSYSTQQGCSLLGFRGAPASSAIEAPNAFHDGASSRISLDGGLDGLHRLAWWAPAGLGASFGDGRRVVPGTTSWVRTYEDEGEWPIFSWSGEVRGFVTDLCRTDAFPADAWSRALRGTNHGGRTLLTVALWEGYVAKYGIDKATFGLFGELHACVHRRRRCDAAVSAVFGP